MMRKLLALACSALLATLAACNTMHGLGQDLEKVGDKIQEKSDRNR
jgi:predicted small secreted protein